MQIMRARAGQHGAQRSVAHNSEHYVELPTTEHGWAGSERSRGHTRAGKRSAVRGRGRLSEAELVSGSAQAATKGNHIKRSHRAGCAASGGTGVRYGAARSEPQALGPAVWGEGRRGGVRAETEGEALSEATEPVCRSLRRQSGGPESWRGAARRDACRVASKRRDGRSEGEHYDPQAGQSWPVPSPRFRRCGYALAGPLASISGYLSRSSRDLTLRGR